MLGVMRWSRGSLKEALREKPQLPPPECTCLVVVNTVRALEDGRLVKGQHHSKGCPALKGRHANQTGGAGPVRDS